MTFFCLRLTLEFWGYMQIFVGLFLSLLVLSLHISAHVWGQPVQ